MLFTNNTIERIVEAMQKGAKLIIVRWAYSESCGSPLKTVYLEHGNWQLRMTHEEPNPHFNGRPFSESRRTFTNRDFETITRDPRVQQGYIYNSDYGDYRELYEHVNTPTPRWVTEQWYSPAAPGEEI